MRGDQVVDHRRPGLPGQFTRCHQAAHRRRRHRVAALVDHEAPVGIAVERQADVGALLAHERLQIDEVGRIQRVGLVVGEVAVQFEIQRQHRDRTDRFEHRRRGVARHAVAGVDGHAQRARTRDIDQRMQKGRVVGQHVAVGDGAARCLAVTGRVDTGDQLVADPAQAGVGTHRLGARPAEFDAVVGGGVVAGGEHRTRAVECAGGEIELVRRGQPDPDHVQAAGHHALGEGRRQHRRTVPHVVADHHLSGAFFGHQPGERRPDLGDEGFIDFRTDQAAYVVRLDHTVDSRSGPRHGQGS